MGLYKRGTVWWMSFTHQGQQYRRSTETEDRKLAQRIFDKLKGEIAEGKWFERLPGGNYTFTDLIEKYLKEYSATHKASSSHVRDKSLAAHLLEVFGDQYLLDITPAMISAYKVRRRKEGASPRTVNYELTLMSHAFTLAIKEWEWLSNNPVKKVKKERLPKPIERWLSPDEEERLLTKSPVWLREIIIFAISTGLRESELLDLKWSQVDTKRKTVTIFDQKNRDIDTLPLNEKAWSVLMDRMKHRTAHCDFIFPSARNTRIGNRNLLRAFYKAMEEAGIQNFRFHDLRHTFATRLVQNEVDLYAVQKLGRWKNVSMVQRYGHHNTESLRSAISVLDGQREPFITILSQSQKKRGQKPHLRLITP